MSYTKLSTGRSVVYLVAILVIFLLGSVLKFNIDLNNSSRLDIDARKYKGTELSKSKLTSRSWMNIAIAINKKENLAPANSARFYSYVASVFADTLQKTGDMGQASLATAGMINYLFPNHKELINKYLDNIASGVVIDSSASEILGQYKHRSQDDGYGLEWDGKTPEGKWYVRDNKKDKGAMAGHWKPWILDPEQDFDVPEPPKDGSLRDKLEMGMVSYVVSNREPKDLHTIYVWHGSTGFEKGSTGDNITPAGVWQNILFVEKGAELNDLDYARAQKLLAQTVADAFIECWKVKYEFWIKRPSMKIPDLDLAVGDPPFPGYVSGHSTISAAAAAVLSYLFPDKENVWQNNARDARNSRLVAGIHFDADNQVGFALGQDVGREVIKKIGTPNGKVSVKNYKPTNSFQALIGLAVLSVRENMDKAGEKIAAFFEKMFGEPISFTNAIDNSGIGTDGPVGGSAWADYNGDGFLDIFLSGGDLYKNNGDGTFTNTTDEAGIKLLKPKDSNLEETRGVGVFADLDNDGCQDFYLSNFGRGGVSEDSLYRNDCDGTFTDVTTTAGIKDTGNSRGVAFSDYNSDGFLDIYVAANSRNNSLSQLYKNNGDWTFTEVGKLARVQGLSQCSNVEILDNPISSKADFINYELRPGPYQPIWFDYNNDFRPDLFVATDFGVSPLYRNDGNGVFTDVTQEVGMCREGTGMGATVGDYDRDGDPDLYVTHVGQNQLWQNNNDGTFIEVSEKAGVANFESLGWGTEFLDYDNDSDPDLYAVNGVVSMTSIARKVVSKTDKLYKNNGDGTFKEVAQPTGITGNDPKLSAAVGDFNNDGFEDIFVGSQLGRFSDNKPSHRLYVNKGNGNNWITLRLVGTTSNRDGVGVKITLKAGGKSQSREIISGSSFLAQRSLWQTFGLGLAKKADSIEIKWPSGKAQTLSDIKSNQTITITEE